MSDFEMAPMRSEPRGRGHEVANHLEVLIRGMKEGDRLGTKSKLQASIGIAAATLNEALRLLQDRGLILVKPGPNGGIFVAAPDPVFRLGQTLLAVHGKTRSVSDAVEIRQALEPLTVYDALEHRKPSDLVVFRKTLLEIERLIDDDENFLRAIWRLHEQIAATNHNDMLRNVYLTMLDIVEVQTSGVVPESKSMEYKKLRLGVHTGLVDAIESQDKVACSKALLAHNL